MICKNCGTEFSTKFCPKCGAAAEESVIKTAPEQPKQSEKKKNGVVIALIAVICVALIAIGACVYLLFFKDDNEAAKEKDEPVSSSETVKDENKKDSKKGENKKNDTQYDFDLSEIEDETLRSMAKTGVLKKHIDYMSSDELEDMVDMVLNADYKETTAEDYVKYFGDFYEKYYEAKGEELDNDEMLADAKRNFEEDGAPYIAIEGNYAVLIQREDYDYDEQYINKAMIYNTKSDTVYVIGEYNESNEDGVFEFGSYVFDKEISGYWIFITHNSDCSDAIGAFMSFDYEAYGVVYDENGDLLTVRVDDEYYDSELNPISEEESNKLIDELSERTGVPL